MIALFGRDEHSVFGIASVLDIEKIPYRRVTSLDAPPGELLLVTGTELSPVDFASLEGRAAVVLHGGERFACEVLGADRAESRSQASAIALDQAIWPASLQQLATTFEKSVLRIPLAPVCTATTLTEATTLAMLSPAHGAGKSVSPAIARRDGCIWSAVDLGAAFANLLTEAYLPLPTPNGTSSRLRLWGRRTAEGAYYAAPDRIRQWVQRRSYALLARRLRGYGALASEYPVDATGWLLIELVKRLIVTAAGTLVRLERWPAPYRAAATLTHDIEPRPYAYAKGLDRLLDYIAAVGHPATIGLVAGASDRFLSDHTVPRLRTHTLICHGLEHRGENVHGPAQVAASVQTARSRLERRVGCAVAGYRSPRLDRSPDLAWALDHHEFRFDSSLPDVDRENMRHFGGGVRLNLPFRFPILDESTALRPSRCLEMPLTAPDCVQPLLAGASVAELRATVETKAAFVSQTGGLYVALVHGGVFGQRDSALREQHLGFVCRQLRQPGIWFDGMDRIVDWWCAREALQLTLRDGAVRLTNGGAQPISGVRVVVEEAERQMSVAVPPLDAGESVAVALLKSSTANATATDEWSGSPVLLQVSRAS